MSLKTSIEVAIVCFSINLIIGIILRFFLLPSGTFPQQSVWMKNLFSFLSLLQMLLLYVPLILFFVALHAELYTSPKQNSKVANMIEPKTPERVPSLESNEWLLRENRIGFERYPFPVMNFFGV